MAFINSSPIIETRFQLNNTPNNFKITDNTDYLTTYGIALADVKGSLVITDPNGVIAHNTVPPAFDIHMSVNTFTTAISLPLDSLGVPKKGIYTVVYTVIITGGTDPGTYVKTFTYNYCNPTITADVDLTVDLICSNLTSTDNTAYPAEIFSTTMTHTVHPPAGLPAATWPVQTTANNLNVYNPITTDTWTGKVSNVIVLKYVATGSSDEHFIDRTITGSSERDVQDDINSCSLACNLRALMTRYDNALQFNPQDAVLIYEREISPAFAYAFMYKQSIECGNFDLATDYYDKVLKYTGSNKDCECGDSDTPTLILAVCSGGASGQTYVTDACGTNPALTVTSVTLGSTTTYTVCFDNTIWTKINALTETDIISSDLSATISSNTVGYIKTYDIIIPPTPAASSPVHVFSGIIDIDFTNKSAAPTLTWRTNWSSTWGNKLQEPTFVNENPLFSDWSAQSNCFYLNGYVDQSGGEYPKPQIQIAEDLNTGQTVIDCSHTRSDFQVEIIELDTANDRIYFRIIQAGIAVSGAMLTELKDKITLSVIINA
jgi:hypothetical protein